jgi:hypothetical protein
VAVETDAALEFLDVRDSVEMQAERVSEGASLTGAMIDVLFICESE